MATGVQSVEQRCALHGVCGFAGRGIVGHAGNPENKGPLGRNLGIGHGVGSWRSWCLGCRPRWRCLTAVLGAGFGLLPIGWIILHVIFLYRLTKEKGEFEVLQNSLTGITQDSRLQLVLIAFAFGAFFEGAAGFGTPVAVTAAILIGLGFGPLQASGLSLIANTAPVAYGALGIPVITLAKVSGLHELDLSAMVGRQLPFFSILIPFYLVWAYAGFRGMIRVWPAVLVAGVSFAIPQFLLSNFHGPSLVDVISSMCSLAAMTVFLMKWHPKEIWGLNGHDATAQARAEHGYTTKGADSSLDAVGHSQCARLCVGATSVQDLC